MTKVKTSTLISKQGQSTLKKSYLIENEDIIHTVEVPDLVSYNWWSRSDKQSKKSQRDTAIEGHEMESKEYVFHTDRQQSALKLNDYILVFLKRKDR